MAANRLEKAYIKITESLDAKVLNILKPPWSDRFLDSRDTQRKVLFRFALCMSTASFLFLVILLGIQTYCRIAVDPHFEVVSDTGLEILSVSVFGQIFGVVYIIANALWDSKEFDYLIRLFDEKQRK